MMPKSPAGHTIETMECDPDKIWNRGTEMKTLGDAMISSATVLAAIKDGEDGSVGQSISQLRDAIGDLTDDLKEAGKSYQNVGPVLVGYADVLREGGEGVMKKLNDAATACQDVWPRVQSSATAIPTKDGPMGGSVPDTEHPDYESAKSSAEGFQQQFDEQAGIFDTNYDKWSSAFEDAANRIDGFNDDGIEDSWLDDVHMDAIVDALITVLTVAGLVVLVLAIVIGGPFVLIGLAIAGGLLALTLFQKARGEASWGDVAWAVAGILPFGKLAKVTKGLTKLSRALGQMGGKWAAAGRKLRNFQVAVKQAELTRRAGRTMKDLQAWVRQRGNKDAWARALFDVDSYSQLRGVPGKFMILPFILHKGVYAGPINDLFQLPQRLGDLPGRVQYAVDHGRS